MKTKKLFLPTIILVVAILITAVYSFVSCIAKKPTITEQEFPFSITYELNGETVTIDDTYVVRYDKNGGYTNSKTRYYVGKIGDMSEDTTHYILREDENGRIELNTMFYADYLMGDPEYDYFDDVAFEPQLYYYDAQEQVYEDQETLSAQGVKLVGFEYPTPIKNSFVFSHISILDADIVLPSLLIGFIALLVTIIFVKKEKDFVRKPINVVSTVFNFLIAIISLPYLTVCALLLDALGDNESILNQIFYFLPVITVLGITASVALRRKGYSISALIVQFIGVAILALILLIGIILGLL